MNADADQPPPTPTASRTVSPTLQRPWIWVAGCGCSLVAGTVLLGAVAVLLFFVLRPRPVDPLNNVLNERLVWHGLGVSAKPEPVEPSFMVGFENARWPSEHRDIDQKLHEDGTVVHTMRSNRGSHVTTVPDGARIKRLHGTLKLADGRTIQLDRAYAFNEDGTVTIRDTSVTTDARGQELRNNLVEKSDDAGRIVSITGVMTSSFTGEHKINRTYTHAGADVRHVDHK